MMSGEEVKELKKRFESYKLAADEQYTRALLEVERLFHGGCPHHAKVLEKKANIERGLAENFLKEYSEAMRHWMKSTTARYYKQ